MSRRSDEFSTVARAAVVRASVSYRPLALSQGCSASLGARRLAYSSSSLAKATPHADARVERRRRVGTRYTSRDYPGARRRHRRGYRPFVEFDRRGGVGWGDQLSNKDSPSSPRSHHRAPSDAFVTNLARKLSLSITYLCFRARALERAPLYCRSRNIFP